MGFEPPRRRSPPRTLTSDGGLGLRYYFNHPLFVEVDALRNSNRGLAEYFKAGPVPGVTLGCGAGEDERDHRSQAGTPAGRGHRGVAHNPVAVRPGYDALAREYGNRAFSLRIGASNNRHDSHASANAGAVAAP